ncbi:MAG TPA: hypothetical protein VFE37_20875 [Chloroflexota bacterium]|nr:hypothetical protein [Chloroflexota bacterium]
METTVLGYFHDRAAADAAYQDLLQRGVPQDTISVLGRGAEHEAARYYDERLRDGGVLLAVRADPAEADALRAILANRGADSRNLAPAAPNPDWPGGEAVDLTRNDRRQYLSGPEDMARTTAARDNDELLPVDENARRP